MKHFRLKRVVALAIFLFVGLPVLMAQVKVSGQIVDEQGEPLMAVSILEKGTANGIITDIDGNFELSVRNNGAVLVISYVGYVTQEVKVQTDKKMNIILKEDSQALEELVVVGYGVQINKAIFNNKGKIFKLENERDYGSIYKVPSLIQSEDIYNLLDSINAKKSSSAKGLWGFSDDDISKCITWLKDTTIDDADLEVAIYRISKSDCLKFLARPDAKEILNEKCINIRFYHGTLFDITFIFSDGNELVIKPQSLYKGAYWLVGKDNYVRNDVVTPFLEKTELYS
jgi:hypothetical protein